MDVNIVTVYQSPNYGSFLQAWALYQTIGKKYPVKMVDAKVRNPFFNAVIPAIKRIFKGLITFNFKYVVYNLKKILYSLNSFNLIEEIDLSSAHGSFVFGSDEIWNLKRPEMNRFPILWGEGISDYRKISYAPSINNCTEEELIKYDLLKAVKNFMVISVRDNYSKQILQTLTGRDVVKVVDPTMLLSREFYIDNMKAKNLENYIAVYLFDPNPEVITCVKAIAKATDKRLVSVGLWAPWCDDVVVSINPFEYYVNADFVITDTFHGTAFSINLEKQFITFPRGMKKVSELLSDYDLTDRDATGLNVEDALVLLEKEIDYKYVREKLEKNRKDSLNFLYSAIEKMTEDYV